MTLRTDVWILRATVSPRDLFHLGRGWLGCTEKHTFSERPRHPAHGQPSYIEIGNDLGQGLAAIWEVLWCPDAPYRAADHECERDAEGWPINSMNCIAYDCNPGPACAYAVSMDSTYGGTGPSARDTHAYLISEIAKAVGEENLMWNADSIGEDLPFSKLDLLGDPVAGRVR